jgi:hypothetical protein
MDPVGVVLGRLCLSFRIGSLATVAGRVAAHDLFGEGFYFYFSGCRLKPARNSPFVRGRAWRAMLKARDLDASRFQTVNRPSLVKL